VTESRAITEIDGKISIEKNIRNKSFFTDCNGYEVKYFDIKNIMDTLFLKRKDIILSEVKVSNKKTKNIELGNHLDKTKSSKIEFETKNNNIYAVLLKNNRNSFNYIKKLKFKLKKNNSAKVYIRPYIYSVDNDNNPLDEILNKNIIYEVKKSEDTVIIDVEELNIELTENGLYLGIELIKDTKSINIGIGKSKKRNSFILYKKINKTIAIPLKIGGDEILNWQFGIEI
jgi:hypothetical protein